MRGIPTVVANRKRSQTGGGIYPVPLLILGRARRVAGYSEDSAAVSLPLQGVYRVLLAEKVPCSEKPQAGTCQVKGCRKIKQVKLR